MLAALASAVAMHVPALAQTAASGQDGTVSVSKLIADGYEIKAAAPNGSKYVVFLQKDRKAYACEFVTLTASRCGEIK